MLEGKLVRLRAIEPGDLEACYRWMNDREVTHFLAMKYPMSYADEQGYIERVSSSNFARGVSLAIETKDGGAHIGNLSLEDPHSEHRTAALGIAIGEKDYWANGYGTDAIVTLLRFGFHEMNLNRVSLHVFEFNERAQACYKKCGFQVEGRLRENYYAQGRYWDVVVMGILRDEFEALHGTSA